MNGFKKIINTLFSTSAAGLYIILFAVAIGAATFVENDFGTSSAQKVIFQARWFELLLVLFGVSLIVNVFKFRMIQNKKWAIFTFHISIIIILLGAAVTRYTGYEGMMHIREGSASDTFLSSETFLKFEAVKDGKKYVFNEPVLFATLGNNKLKRSYVLDGEKLNIEVLQFIPNPGELMVSNEDGLPILKVVIGGANGREEYMLRYMDRVTIHGTLFNFGNTEEPGAFNIKYENGDLLFKTNTPFTQMVMATQQLDTIQPGTSQPLRLRSLYSSGSRSFVFGDFKPKASVEIVSTDSKMTNSSIGGVDLKITMGDKSKNLFVIGQKGVAGRPRLAEVGNASFKVSYGAKSIPLPFGIALRDFIMEKYPGTNNASSYASEVTLVDHRKDLHKDFRIYMNNILNYGGYRFFQSSFDQDELGTYLSVNHDAWGTWISYLGYALLTIGMVLTFFSSKSRFRQLAKKARKIRMPNKALAGLIVLFFLGFSIPANGYSSTANKINAIDINHAERFGELVMQDHQGRFKPMDTYTSEILRKLSRKESIQGLTAEQVVLGMAASPQDWYGVPLIKMGKHEKIKSLVKVHGKLAAYRDFFDLDGKYKLRSLVRDAYSTDQKDRGVLEKELLKIDERINICGMVFSGRFMKSFPVPGDETYAWQSPPEHHRQKPIDKNSSFTEKFYPVYIPVLQNALEDGDWKLANELLDELELYQQKFGGPVLPSKANINAELLLNKLKVFSRLGKWYGLLGFGFLVLLFTSVLKPGVNLKWPVRIALGLLALCFLFHTFGLGLRWYVSGRAPWSNGYESMIYIGFTTVLAGLIFARKSLGGLTATTILASTILMVATLSYLDPEITPLVPVLKSYWLTIHVSLIAGSYGFLMLGAIIGVLNLVFMIFANQKNGKNVYRIINEMTTISEMTLIAGLFMISIGTYLGGVWANESWGRYWGWDAKETWALVTILIYAFILHMRFIPGFKGVFAFNVATLFGWASVIMTYFGVNYYLSGLHSYAAGDPVPIPSYVYYMIIALTLISLLAYWKDRKYRKAVPKG